MIKAIETVYNGYRFRSRLEARWAVFFDAMSIKYEYEKEGFNLGEYGWYLPDFFIPCLETKYGVYGGNCWVEIKPEKPSLCYINDKKMYATISDDYRKCQKLAEYSGKAVMLIGGFPWVKRIDYYPFVESEYELTLFLPDMIVNDKNSSPNGIESPFPVDGCALPDEQFFSSSIPGLYGFIYRQYQKNPNYFTCPMPERGDAKALVRADREYYQAIYKRNHPTWEYFITVTGLAFSKYDDLGRLRLGNVEHIVKSQECKVTQAYETARQARFEYGENGRAH